MMTDQQKSRPGKGGSDLLGGCDRYDTYSQTVAIASQKTAGA